MKVKFSINQISFGTLSRICGGELHQGALGEVYVTHICTDSREADAKTAFVALRGERVDGHDYIRIALENGCRCVICEHRTPELAASDATSIVVNDTELALSRLASAYRRYLSCSFIGVTGSVGKTTAKDLISSVLAVKQKTYHTPGNHNSLVGMPLSMLEIPIDTRWAVLEMGMSNFGEVERLSITAEPEIAVITNVGSSHMASLGSIENIRRAKLEILCGLRTRGTLLLNGDDPMLKKISGKSYRTLYVSIKRENADFFAKNIRVEPDATYFDAVWKDGEEKDLCIRVIGRHNVYAALYAFAIGILSGMTPDQIREGLYTYLPSGMRQDIYPVKGMTFIEDCYNASTESMIAALDVLSEYGSNVRQRTVAVLGDMLNLGPDSPALHRKVGHHLAQKEIDLLFALGEGGGQIAIGARQGKMPVERICQFPDANQIEAIATRLMETLKEGDVVLFKASRGLCVERIVALLKERL